MSLRLYNTLTRQKETFEPIDPLSVRMYVCGPTVYDFAHIGNARPVIVFDVLFRLLREIYGAQHVTYVRNITDVDDKINARAAERYPDLAPEIGIRRLTEDTAAQFHKDIAALGVLEPTVEPRATEHIVEMVALCNELVAKGHAYVAADHVLFDVSSMADYGRLSNRSLEEMEAGARVEVAPYKKGPMDFVLWKPSKPGEPAWTSPAGITTSGRPGWHIECSAMAGKHLGDVFDIHGGGIDLAFPHHENEIAQSRCAHGTDVMARVWMHNGFLQVEGEKMSKSLGNFITINELLETGKFGGCQWHGRVVRFAMLGTHYRQPIDWTVDRLVQARATLFDLSFLHGVPVADGPHPDVVAALSDDLNTPSAISIIHGLAKSAHRNAETAAVLKATLQFMGLYGDETQVELNPGHEARTVDTAKVEPLIAARLEARRRKDFKESDRIRDELAAMGVTLKDTKNKDTGEIETTWEIAR
ncbi:MAG: cysteine--tRNA ligase [Hyphomicrobium sp. 32-62-53]|nr:MAG: cysteine--tRNA ligase [Hyphomicrobium sp. 12-62-95]OYY00067.1 MAG: cysteine--tRNA ligase [Hyphomicrobium sp. 32-62-53]